MATPRLTPDQLNQVSRLVAQYISSQREKYVSRAVPLSAKQKATLAPFFSSQLLESTRVLVLQVERVGNPEFYPMLRDLLFKNLPDQSGMGPQEGRPDLQFWGGTRLWVVSLRGKWSPLGVTQQNPDETYDLRWLDDRTLVFDRVADVMFYKQARIWKAEVAR